MSQKNKKHRPLPKPDRQIPNSMIRPMKFLGPRHYLEHAREYPILGCWIMEGWYESGITPVLVVREQEPGRVMLASCMVDLTCLGIKDAYTRVDISLSQFERALPDLCSGKPEKCSVDLAHEVIYGALEYAERYGFQPHPDFKVQMVDLVLDPPDAHPRVDNVSFGRAGKPFYISGPYDDERKRKFVFDTLMRTAGEGNFDFMIGLGELSDTLGGDDFTEWLVDDADEL
jgi:hypothetical protein